jgi:hypothetical protein
MSTHLTCICTGIHRSGPVVRIFGIISFIISDLSKLFRANLKRLIENLEPIVSPKTKKPPTEVEVGLKAGLDVVDLERTPPPLRSRQPNPPDHGKDTDQSPPEPVAFPVSRNEEVITGVNRKRSYWRWTKREDTMLYDLAEKTPRNWTDITTKLNEHMGREKEAARTKRAVTNRYSMRELVKSKKRGYLWTIEEETFLGALLTIHKEIRGKKKWDIIADAFHEKFKYDEDGNIKKKRSADAMKSYVYGS